MEVPFVGEETLGGSIGPSRRLTYSDEGSSKLNGIADSAIVQQ